MQSSYYFIIIIIVSFNVSFSRFEEYFAACQYLKVTVFCLDIAPSGDWLWYHLPVLVLLLQKAHKGRFTRR